MDHAQHVFDAAVWGLAVDALLHHGPLDVSVDRALCPEAVMPHVDPIEALQRGVVGIYLASVTRQSASRGKIDGEPELRDYAGG